MSKHKKPLAAAMSCVMVSACLGGGLMGCGYRPDSYDSEYLNMLAESLALSLMGNDAYAWNIYSVNPEQSFGYEPYGDASWYSYSKATINDMRGTAAVLKNFNTALNEINFSSLNAADAVTYRNLQSILDTYIAYYSSQYAVDFTLIGGSYIDTMGGYVASFADMCENYSFRTVDDMDTLLNVTVSTKDAFESYLDYAGDRVQAGYPLYDYTITGMQNYLNDVYDKGDEYYLYTFMNNKIESVEFLTAEQKAEYKTDYKTALDNSFMAGVKTLSDGLDVYKGNVVSTEKSYLASYGNAGKAYYEWMFKNKTGINNANLSMLYLEMATAQSNYADEVDRILDEANGLEQTNKTVYDDFHAYVNGEKLLLGLSDPYDILDYLKVAAKSIVPDLNNVPEIDFKYMDDTVAQISNVLAYYLYSPLDEENSTEHITINGYLTEKDPSDLITLIAHEGYPGHLYAAVNAKERGEDLLGVLSRCTSFAEGWAKYMELAVLDYIADETDDMAVELYCEYKKYYTLAAYLNMALNDMVINYFGNSVTDLVELGLTETEARSYIENIMEMPVVYIPYGYGMYYILNLHDKAKSSLGDKYDEVKFNGALLSEGFAPTLDRARTITAEYISKNR